jgi:hypothetical protein
VKAVITRYEFPAGVRWVVLWPNREWQQFYTEQEAETAIKEKEAMKDQILADRQRVKFSLTSGNDPRAIVTIESHETHNGQVFYRLKEVSGGLFVRESLIA